MPAFHSTQLARHAHLGSSAGDILYNLITEPSRILIPYQRADVHKIDGLMLGIMIMIFGGAYLTLLRPWFLIGLIGFTAWRYLGAELSLWLQIFQYSAELAPFFSIVLIDILRDMKFSKKYKMRYPLLIKIVPFFLLVVVLVLNVIGTMRLGIATKQAKNVYHELANSEKTKQRNFLYEAIRLIPDSTKVLTQGNFTPHLLNRSAGFIQENWKSNGRDQLKFFAPDYVLVSLAPHFLDSLSKDTSTFEYKNFQGVKNMFDASMDDSNYRVLFHQGDVYLFKRKDDEVHNP